MKHRLRTFLISAAMLSMMLVAAPPPAAWAAKVDGFVNCPHYDANDHWGVEIRVYIDDWAGGHNTWCPKLWGSQWDGDATFDSSDMSWQDIGDSGTGLTQNMHDLTSTYSIIIDQYIESQNICVSFFHSENFHINSILEYPLEVIIHHTLGQQDVIHAALNQYHNDSFDSVRITKANPSYQYCADPQ